MRAPQKPARALYLRSTRERGCAARGRGGNAAVGLETTWPAARRLPGARRASAGGTQRVPRRAGFRRRRKWEPAVSERSRGASTSAASCCATRVTARATFSTGRAGRVLDRADRRLRRPEPQARARAATLRAHARRRGDGTRSASRTWGRGLHSATSFPALPAAVTVIASVIHTRSSATPRCEAGRRPRVGDRG